MPIRNQIEAVVNQLVAAPKFLYGTKDELNVLLDALKPSDFPAVLLLNIPVSEVSNTLSMAVGEKFSLYMEFINQTTFDQNTADNEDVINGMAALRDEFLVKLQFYRESEYAARYFKIKEGEKAKSNPIYNKKDVNSTGVRLSMSLNTMNNTFHDPTSRPPVTP